MAGAGARRNQPAVGAPGRSQGGVQGRAATRQPGRRRAIAGAGKGRRRVPALLALVALFVLAGVIRLALGIDGALAQGAGGEPRISADASAAEERMDDAPTPAMQAMSGDGSAPDDEDIAEIVLDLRQREARLAERAEKVEERLALLAAAEERVTRQIEALRAAETELDATMALADELAEGDLSRLVAVFEAMRAEQAARVFAEMDPSFAAGFLGRLRPETAAGILAGLEPHQAYALSTILAGRNAEVPTRTQRRRDGRAAE